MSADGRFCHMSVDLDDVLGLGWVGSLGPDCRQPARFTPDKARVVGAAGSRRVRRPANARGDGQARGVFLDTLTRCVEHGV